MSTTALAILQGAGQEDDPYKADTLQERAYMRSLNPAKFALQSDVELLDNEDALNKVLDKAIFAGEFDLPLDQVEEQEQEDEDNKL